MRELVPSVPCQNAPAIWNKPARFGIPPKPGYCVADPHTIKASMHVSSAPHLDRVKGFFQTAIENEQFIIFCIDDYHNIHTKHRPETKTQT